MRLLHPKTLEIASKRDDLRKTIISHAWSEVFKYKGGKRSHPKMFIDNDRSLGRYMGLVYHYGIEKGCNLDHKKLKKFSKEFQYGFKEVVEDPRHDWVMHYFDDCYLFSDACSLYYKGDNIFPDIFGDDWRKYVPVESHKEIIWQCNKTLSK